MHTLYYRFPQLLAFARIFAHNPSIFVLDEATANIDTHTEGLIQKSIDTISKAKTSIFIAHRLATIVNVDKIIVHIIKRSFQFYITTYFLYYYPVIYFLFVLIHLLLFHF